MRKLDDLSCASAGKEEKSLQISSHKLSAHVFHNGCQFVRFKCDIVLPQPTASDRGLFRRSEKFRLQTQTEVPPAPLFQLFEPQKQNCAFKKNCRVSKIPPVIIKTPPEVAYLHSHQRSKD